MAMEKTILKLWIVTLFAAFDSLAHPLTINKGNDDKQLTEVEREPRQFNFQQRPDGTFAGSISLANAMDGPGFDNAFALSESFEIGPKGSSTAFSSAVNSDVLGNKMSFANANAQSTRQGLFGADMSSANAMANSFSNPLFSGSNAQSNAFNSNNPFGGISSFRGK